MGTNLKEKCWALHSRCPSKKSNRIRVVYLYQRRVQSCPSKMRSKHVAEAYWMTSKLDLKAGKTEWERRDEERDLSRPSGILER